MKNLAIVLSLLFIFIGACASAQIEATTKDGRKVILNDDGTWKYTEVNSKKAISSPLLSLDCAEGCQVPVEFKNIIVTSNSEAKLKRSPNINSKTATSVRKGEKLEIIGYAYYWFKVIRVEFGSEGYIQASLINRNEQTNAIEKHFAPKDILAQVEIEKKAAKIKEEEAKIKEEEDKAAAYKKLLIEMYGKKDALRILNKEYWIGMTDTQARSSLGNPENINRTTTASTKSEQWVYERYDLYLYFDNGICTSFQD